MLLAVEKSDLEPPLGIFSLFSLTEARVTKRVCARERIDKVREHSLDSLISY